MLNPNQYELVKFVREASKQAPAAMRIKVLRGMADFLGAREDAALRDGFAKSAAVLEQAENEVGQLDMKFNQDGHRKP